VVDVKEVHNHDRRLLLVIALTGRVKRQAFVRISATGDKMVEVGDVATFGDLVEECQREVPRAQAVPSTVVLVLVVGPVDVDTLIK
jgi:hypothetical protein